MSNYFLFAYYSYIWQIGSPEWFYRRLGLTSNGSICFFHSSSTTPLPPRAQHTPHAFTYIPIQHLRTYPLLIRHNLLSSYTPLSFFTLLQPPTYQHLSPYAISLQLTIPHTPCDKRTHLLAQFLISIIKVCKHPNQNPLRNFSTGIPCSQPNIAITMALFADFLSISLPPFSTTVPSVCMGLSSHHLYLPSPKISPFFLRLLLPCMFLSYFNTDITMSLAWFDLPLPLVLSDYISNILHLVIAITISMLCFLRPRHIISSVTFSGFQTLISTSIRHICLHCCSISPSSSHVYIMVPGTFSLSTAGHDISSVLSIH